MLDNVLEFLVHFSEEPLHILLMLIPEADRPDMDPDIRAFHEYHATLMEPWDGPAALIFSDGRYAAAILDRNGLRPERFWQTRDGIVILASEAGVVHVEERDIVRKGRLGPGQIFAVDTLTGEVLDDDTIKRRSARRRPYRRWIRRRKVDLPCFPGAFLSLDTNLQTLELRVSQLVFGYGREDLDRVLRPMLLTGAEPVGSMGDDTPLAVLSAQPQLLYRYFSNASLRSRIRRSIRCESGWSCHCAPWSGRGVVSPASARSSPTWSTFRRR